MYVSLCIAILLLQEAALAMNPILNLQHMIIRLVTNFKEMKAQLIQNNVLS